ncbi:hypothetical protein AB1Y20_000887 [Prymnesium parvum]|uniref:SGF29 C-terminal domain-containing protein n=1 Tax=Prymnesium parvum TaxID=97485 RepID=A0AB34KBX7_PRYPA
MEEGSRSSDQMVTIRLRGSHSLVDPLFILGTHVVAKVHDKNADDESQTEYLLALVVGYHQERNEYTVWDVDVEPEHPSGKHYCVPCTDLARFPRRRTYVKGQHVLSRWPIDGDPKTMSSVFYSVEICGTIDQNSVQVRSNQDDSITVVDILDIALPPELPEPDMEELKRLRKMLRKKEKGITPAAGLPEPDVDELKRLRKIARTEEKAREKLVEQKSMEQKSVQHKNVEHTSVELKSVEHKSSEHKPLEHKSVELKAVEHMAVEYKPLEQKSVELKAVERMTVEHKTVEHKSVELKAVERMAVEHTTVEHKSVELKAVERMAVEHTTVEHKSVELAVEHMAVEHKTVEHKSVERMAVERMAVEHMGVEHKSVEHESVELMTVEHKPVEHIESALHTAEPEEQQQIREWRVRLGLAPEPWAPPRGGSAGEVPAPAPALCELVADNLPPDAHLKSFKLKAPKQRRVVPTMFAEEMDFDTACSN